MIEYCPVSAGVEAAGERWTLLVLRELMLGSHRFNDLHRGLPGISRTLLSARLRQMETRGLITRRVDGTGRPEYRLTPAGAELEPILWQLGDWARRWFFGEPELAQLDGAWLLWRLRQFVLVDALPERRVVVEFVFTGPAADRSWLVLAPGEVSACRQHPGYDTDVWVTSDLAEMYRVLMGVTTLAAARTGETVRVDGEPELVRSFADWWAWRGAPGD